MMTVGWTFRASARAGCCGVRPTPHCSIGGWSTPGAHTDETKKSDGAWRVTAKGLHFLCGTITVPKKAFIYNNQVEGWSDECVSFSGLLADTSITRK